MATTKTSTKGSKAGPYVLSSGWPLPDKPLPSPPQKRQPVSPDWPSSDPDANTVSPSSSTYRSSLAIAPLSIHRPRPDSTILSAISPPLQRPSPLDRRDFAALVRRGDILQYWLPVELVLKGLPGRECVPTGHWERLVALAGDVRVKGDDEGVVQLVTSWCSVEEQLGDEVHEGQRNMI